jgi:hypothetical protein
MDRETEGGGIEKQREDGKRSSGWRDRETEGRGIENKW